MIASDEHQYGTPVLWPVGRVGFDLQHVLGCPLPGEAIGATRIAVMITVSLVAVSPVEIGP